MHKFFKSDYLKGLLFFILFIFCLCLAIPTPDSENLFYKFLGLFKINPGIQLSSFSTLYVYPIIPLILTVISVKKILKYWQGYGLKFIDYNIFLRLFPVFIAVAALLFSANINSLYFLAVSQRNGMKSVIYYDDAKLEYVFTDTSRTYSYDFTLENLGDKPIEFKVRFSADYNDYFIRDDIHKRTIKDENGEDKIFTLMPNQINNYKGEFSYAYGTIYDYGTATGILSYIILFDDEEWNTPKPVKSSLRNNRSWRILWGN